MPFNFTPKESYKNHNQYKARYKDRPLPKQCKIIKRNGKQCGNYALPHFDVCRFHGGNLARKSITHGSYSKSLKSEIMYYLKSISKKELRGVKDEDYTNETVLQQQLQLTDVLLARAIEQLNLKQEQQASLQLKIEQLEEEGKSTASVQSELEKVDRSIATYHSVIKGHQKTVEALIKSRQDLTKSVKASEAIEKMASSMETGRVEMLAETIKTFLDAGLVKDLDQIKLLVESKNQELDTEVIKYEYEQD